MNVPLVDLKAQYSSLKPQMDAAIQSVLDRTAFILGKEVNDFEQAFAQYVGVKHCVGVCSGTDAIEMDLRASGIGTRVLNRVNCRRTPAAFGGASRKFGGNEASI